MPPPSSSSRGKPTEAVPAKKKLFEEDSDLASSDDDQEEGGAAVGGSSLKINKEYARRFEHNKKREELQRLEEKYGSSTKGKAIADGDSDEDSSESSEDETEDEDAHLVTDQLDAEISATLQALRSKDPRIYDKTSVFYKPFDASEDAPSKQKEEKPITLRDYHRERYMRGDIGADEEEAPQQPRPKTYDQKQQELKEAVVSELKAAIGDEEEWSDDDAFLKPKKAQESQNEALGENGIHPSRAAALKPTLTELDVANADKNPEDYLTKFMATKAWVPEEGSRWAAFDSDEDDAAADEKADEFEHAYNMRFEDPEKSNEVLKSFSRNVVTEKSVRREEMTGRKRQRMLEQEKKEAEKQERREEKARLRRLKVEEAAEKLAKIKKAAGISGKALKEEDWAKFLDDAWENDKWEEEMTKAFGEDYYAEEDNLSLGGGEDDDDEDEQGAGHATKKKNPKKPKWDDDIDIKDLIPDFDGDNQPAITLSDSEPEAAGAPQDEDDDDDDDEDDEGRPTKKRKTAKDHKLDKINAKREARKERMKLEAFVESKMELDNPSALAAQSRAKAPAFRYREVSPNAFGMTSRDILLAPNDAALNEFAGLKKLATYRDADKKRKDKKKLGKKARLREWRRETFGREFEHSGPTFGFERLLGPEAAAAAAAAEAAPRETGEENTKKKRKRSKNKGGAKVTEA